MTSFGDLQHQETTQKDHPLAILSILFVNNKHKENDDKEKEKVMTRIGELMNTVVFMRCVNMKLRCKLLSLSSFIH